MKRKATSTVKYANDLKVLCLEAENILTLAYDLSEHRRIFSLLFISLPDKLLFLRGNFPYLLLLASFLSLYDYFCYSLSPSEQHQRQRQGRENNVDFPTSWQLLRRVGIVWPFYFWLLGDNAVFFPVARESCIDCVPCL